MKKILTVILLLVLLASLTSCGDRYISSYSAIGMVKSQSSEACEATFFSLKGRLVFKLQSEKEGDISYSVQADEGELFLYYDIYDSKQELAHATAGESITDRGGYIESGKTVYIIIEAPEAAKGRVSVGLCE